MQILRVRQGIGIAYQLKVYYDGIQPGYKEIPATFQFTDPITGSTTYGRTLEEAKANIEKMRERFKCWKQKQI